MEQPAWVSSGSVRKFVRAVAQLTKENADRRAQGKPEVEITEAAVKELYVKWGGLVLVVDEPASVPTARVEDEVPEAKHVKKAK